MSLEKFSVRATLVMERLSVRVFLYSSLAVIPLLKVMSTPISGEKDSLRLTVDKIFNTKYDFSLNKQKEINLEECSNKLVAKIEKKTKEKSGEFSEKIDGNQCGLKGSAHNINDMLPVNKLLIKKNKGSEDKSEKKRAQISCEDSKADSNEKAEELMEKSIKNDIITRVNEDGKNNENTLSNNNKSKNNIENSNKNDPNTNASLLNNAEQGQTPKIPKENTPSKKDSNSTNKEQSKDIKNNTYISPYPVPGYGDSENLWEFICDISEPKAKSSTNSYAGVKHLLEVKGQRGRNNNKESGENKSKR